MDTFFNQSQRPNNRVELRAPHVTRKTLRVLLAAHAERWVAMKV
jgi:hypothetical protein